MQKLSAAPRPTRPRSWCSCASPKRSACSITISVALATSTPTSITVVATSTSSARLANACITADFSARGQLPVQQSDLQIGQQFR